MADYPMNPYMTMPTPDWRQVLSNALIGVGAGISGADASGRGWGAGIGPGLMMSANLTGQQQQQAWQRQMQGLQYQSMLDQRRAQEEARREKLDMAKAAAARDAAMGSQISTMLGMNVQPSPIRMGPPQDVGERISGIESGGRYDAVGVPNSKGNRAYGKYQVMDFNIPTWTQEVLGRPMTPQEFLASPQAQDAVFKAKFGEASKQYGGDEPAARWWFAGPGGMNNPNARDVLGTSVADYSRKFTAGRPPVAQGDAIAGQGDAPSQQSAIASLPPEVRQGIAIMAQRDPEKAVQMMVQALQNQKKEDVYTPLSPESAKMFGLDPSKSWQMNKVTRKIEQIGGSQVQIDMGQKGATEFVKQRADNYENKIRPQAQAAVGEITSMHSMRQLLDSGAFTGLGAEQKLWVARAGELLGVPNEQVANTQALMGAAAERVLSVVKSLGANPSNADREYLEKAKGGTISFSEDGLRRILDIGERMARDTIKRHGTEVQRIRKIPALGEMPEEYFQLDDVPDYATWSKANPLPPLAAAPPPSGPAQSQTMGSDYVPALDPANIAKNIQAPKDKAAYDKIPKGTTYLHPDGTFKVKR